MRKLGAALLALPVVIGAYLASLPRRGAGFRIALIGGASIVIVLGAVALTASRPAPSAAVLVTPPSPVAAELLDTVLTGHGLTDPIVVSFDAPMDPATVAGALRLVPDAPVRLAWDAAGEVLTVEPLGYWTPDTLYAVTIDPSARSAAGGALVAKVRALVLTESAGEGRLTASAVSAGRARLDTAFVITLDRPVALADLDAAIRTTPVLAGRVAVGDAPGVYLFRPVVPLAPDTLYQLTLQGLVDADGVPFGSVVPAKVRTVKAPSVVRFRPRAGTAEVSQGAALSVRFSEGMNHKLTAAAFTVTVNGKPVTGKITWAESGTVLVFKPAKALPYSAKVVLAVSDGAVSTTGVPIASGAKGTFTVIAKPTPPAPGKPSPISHSGGSGAVSGSWTAVEAYYLRLMNCTRTGGWVTSSGSCSSPGGRSVAPLVISTPISNYVSRPYAKLLAVNGWCNHFIGGSPGDRLKRKGFTNYVWAENLGCRSGDPFTSVLGSHLFFQNEKPYNGGHYRNLMNPAYDRAGIGVWVSSGRVRLVVDFYHP